MGIVSTGTRRTGTIDAEYCVERLVRRSLAISSRFSESVMFRAFSDGTQTDANCCWLVRGFFNAKLTEFSTIPEENNASSISPAEIRCPEISRSEAKDMVPSGSILARSPVR